MDPHWLGLTLGTQFTTAVLEIANQFLLLGIDRYRRFTGRKRGFHRRIDVSELLIAVRVIAALAGLAVALAAVLQVSQQVRHNTLARREPLRSQRLHQVTQAAADPTQRRSRIPTDGVLDQSLQGRWQTRLMRHCTLAPAAATTHSGADVIAS
jgi:hypothetical protein